MSISRAQREAVRDFLQPENLQEVALKLMEDIRPQLSPSAPLEKSGTVDKPIYSFTWAQGDGQRLYRLTANNEFNGSSQCLRIYLEDFKDPRGRLTWYVGPLQGHRSGDICATVTQGDSRKFRPLTLGHRLVPYVIPQEFEHEHLVDNILREVQDRLDRLKSPART